MIKTHTIFHLLGHWGECDPKTCPTNTSFTQDDNQIALEAKELIDQYKASDATNKKLDASLVNPTSTTNDCPCIKATQCKRIVTLLKKAKDISRAHPERKEVINYVRSQTCDAKTKTQAVRCCGTQVVDDRDIQPTTPRKPSGTSNKVCISNTNTIIHRESVSSTNLNLKQMI